MSMRIAATVVALCLMLPVFPFGVQAHADPVSPDSGFYSFSVSDAHIAGPVECRSLSIFSYGEATRLYWPGPQADGAVLRKLEGAAKIGTYLRVMSMPKTPKAGKPLWLGKISTFTAPETVPPQSADWKATITYVDAGSFLLRYQLKVVTDIASCTLTNTAFLIRTG
jgi:hypothetical protein